MKKQRWFISGCCLLQAFLTYATPALDKSGSAQQSSSKMATINGDFSSLIKTYDFQNFKFDTAKLLPLNNHSPKNNFNKLETKNFKLSQHLSAGFFVYKIEDKIKASFNLPTLPLAAAPQTFSSNSVYAHLLGQVVQHIFIDLASGYGQNESNYTMRANNGFFSNNYVNKYNKNWFASATALFTHTWKEFAFNANLTAMHAEANQDPFATYFSHLANSAPFMSDALHKVSFLQENAELTYHGNSLVHPFIDGGLLQLISANKTFSFNGAGLLAALNLDTPAFKVGGGLAVNYNRYMLRLEQQYIQRGNFYHGNQSTLSFKMLLG